MTLWPHVAANELIDDLWALGLITGPVKPRVHLTTEQDLIASADLGPVSIATPAAALPNAGAVSTWPEALDVVASLVGKLNVALRDHANYEIARLEDLTFLELAAHIQGRALAASQINPAPIRVRHHALGALLTAATDHPVTTESGAHLVPRLIETLDNLGDQAQPPADTWPLLAAGAETLGLTASLIDEFAAAAHTCPSQALETLGYLIGSTGLLGLHSSSVVIIPDVPNVGRAFRVAGPVQAGRAATFLVSDPIPTAVITTPTFATAADHARHAIEVALAALFAADESLCAALTERHGRAEDGGDAAAA